MNRFFNFMVPLIFSLFLLSACEVSVDFDPPQGDKKKEEPQRGKTKNKPIVSWNEFQPATPAA